MPLNIHDIICWDQPEIRVYLPFSDWSGSKRTSVWIQINRKMVNTIWFQVDSIRLRKSVSVVAFERKTAPESRWENGDPGMLKRVHAGQFSAFMLLVLHRTLNQPIIFPGFLAIFILLSTQQKRKMVVRECWSGVHAGRFSAIKLRLCCWYCTKL